MAKIPFASSTWKEGRVWDLWMVVHFFSGVTVGFANSFLGLPTTTLFFITAVAMIVWEMIEIFNGVHEVAENRILDILFGLTGFFGAIKTSQYLLEPGHHGAFYTSLFLLALGCFFGWRAYHKRVENK